MTVRVAVIADSSSGITPDLARRWGVRIVPLHVSLGDDDFLDLVDLPAGELYGRLAGTASVLRTAAPNPSAWCRAYEQAFADGHESAVVVAVSADISGVADHARVGARDFDRVTVIDSRHGAGSQALLAALAADAATRGDGHTAVVDAVHAAIPRAHVFLVLATLRHLARSGRIPASTSLPPGHPVITVHEGRVQPMAVADADEDQADTLLRLVADLPTPSRLLALHSDDEQAALWLAGRLRRRYANATVDAAPLSAVVGGHCGPGTLGVGVLEA